MITFHILGQFNCCKDPLSFTHIVFCWIEWDLLGPKIAGSNKSMVLPAAILHLGAKLIERKEDEMLMRCLGWDWQISWRHQFKLIRHRAGAGDGDNGPISRQWVAEPWRSLWSGCCWGSPWPLPSSSSPPSSTASPCPCHITMSGQASVTKGVEYCNHD